MAEKEDIAAVVQKMSALARLGFAPSELGRFTEKARAVLSYVAELSELSTAGIEPTSHAVEAGSGLRKDVALPSGLEEPLCAAMPARDGPFLQVPRVLESEE